MPGRIGPAAILLALVAVPAAFAAPTPATAETVVVECKVSQSTTAGVRTVYDSAARERPDLRQRFAFNVPSGRGCLIVGGACDAGAGRLSVQQDDISIVARSPELQLTYTFLRHSFVLIKGDDVSASNYEDCEAIPLAVTIP